MYFLLEKVNFQCYVSLPEGMPYELREIREIPRVRKNTTSEGIPL